MNERIKYVSEQAVRVRTRSGSVSLAQLYINEQGFICIEISSPVDALGINALTELIAAYQRDGSFRAFAPPQKKWRPYTPEEWLAFTGRVVRCKGMPQAFVVISVIDDLVSLGRLDRCWSPAELLRDFQWFDGSPLGIEESDA